MIFSSTFAYYSRATCLLSIFALLATTVARSKCFDSIGGKCFSSIGRTSQRDIARVRRQRGRFPHRGQGHRDHHVFYPPPILAVCWLQPYWPRGRRPRSHWFSRGRIGIEIQPDCRHPLPGRTADTHRHLGTPEWRRHHYHDLHPCRIPFGFSCRQQRWCRKAFRSSLSPQSDRNFLFLVRSLSRLWGEVSDPLLSRPERRSPLLVRSGKKDTKSLHLLCWKWPLYRIHTGIMIMQNFFGSGKNLHAIFWGLVGGLLGLIMVGAIFTNRMVDEKGEEAIDNEEEEISRPPKVQDQYLCCVSMERTCLASYDYSIDRN